MGYVGNIMSKKNKFKSSLGQYLAEKEPSEDQTKNKPTPKKKDKRKKKKK